MDWRVGRRWIARAAALTAGWATVPALAVGAAGRVRAAPQRATTRDVVTWAPLCDCWGITPQVGLEIVNKAMTPFFAANAPVELRYVPPSGDDWVPRALHPRRHGNARAT